MKTRSRIAGTLAGSAIALGTFVGAGMPAEATSAPADVGATSTQTFRNQAHGGCMDDKGGTLWLRKCSSTKAQKWDVLRTDSGTVKLTNVATHGCLHDEFGSGLGTSRDSSVCDVSRSAEFLVKHWNDGTIRFMSKWTRECVDVDSDGDIGTRKCDKSKSQSWS